ncbi:hypothetical protein SAMN04489713_104262 [Actinomadura madurae]|uniref:Uncharacterized protein n=1 Tax=Actinomadura madurae TaxID=1993 RepID=A0A1I5ESE7_9ACTN|nr:hypothetical protein [Actinomadura madurae]SFO14445.1 hypothetical protein SAMN04489713_104262 [Actinomadura madurae]
MARREMAILRTVLGARLDDALDAMPAAARTFTVKRIKAARWACVQVDDQWTLAVPYGAGWRPVLDVPAELAAALHGAGIVAETGAR